jgi:hypothetical protein
VRLHRSTRLTAVLAVVTLGLVAGAPCAPATAASAVKSCPSGATGQITEAFFTVFSRSDPTAADADARAARLADGGDPALRSVLQAWLLDPAGRESTATVGRVRCTRADRAVVKLDLVLAGTPFHDVLPLGKAVRQDGVWKVAKSTFCARMILENPALATTGACS